MPHDYSKTWDLQRTGMSGLYQLMGKINDPQPLTYVDAASTVGISPWRMQDLKYALERYGILRTTRRFNHDKGRREQLWELLVTEEEAKNRLKQYHHDVDAGKVKYISKPEHSLPLKKNRGVIETKIETAPPESMNTGAPVVVESLPVQGKPNGGVAIAAPESHEEVRAIAGPEPTSPFAALRGLRRDESKAFVYAAKQYRNRSQFITEELAKFQDMGITINPEAITFERDPGFEAVTKALPYIEALEKENENLGRLVGERRQESVDIARLRNDMERLRKLNGQLVRENAGLKDRNFELRGQVASA